MQVNKLDTKDWSRFLEGCSTATFFHTPEWYQVWKNYAGYDYEARLFSFKSGRTALFPLAWRMRLKGLIKEYFSGPLGTYGDLLSPHSLDPEELNKLENYLRKFTLLQIRRNPFQNILPSTFYTDHDFTQVIDLSLDWKSNYKNWSKGHSSAAKKGIREGVKIQKGSAKDWATYFQIYLDTFARWDRPPSVHYTMDLFDELKQLDSTCCTLWVASIDDKMTAGAICFYFQKHVVYWHGASLENYSSFKPVQVLQYHIIQDAIEKKYRWYDFNPSSGLDGVIQFKKGFGTIKRSADLYTQQPFLIKKLFELRRKLKP